MSAPINDGGPAFPAPEAGQQHFGYPAAYPGMSLRDYFAAKAMPQLISLCQDGDGWWSQDNVAQGAYLLADAMLKAREA